jgi:tetratricopeptide (TPR) repeat protein
MLVGTMATATAPVSRTLRLWLVSGACLAVALVSGLGAWMLVQRGGTANSPRPEWLRPVPPALARHLPSGGAAPSSRESFAAAFDAAIGPWQAGNYAEAALRLEELARAFPENADAHFYCGAAWLLAGAPAEAVAPLERALALAPPSLTLDARWYLGLALLDAGRVADARAAFAEACQAGRDRACRAVDHLESWPRRDVSCR